MVRGDVHPGGLHGQQVPGEHLLLHDAPLRARGVLQGSGPDHLQRSRPGSIGAVRVPTTGINITS